MGFYQAQKIEALETRVAELEAELAERPVVALLSDVARIAELERENEELKKDLRKWRVVLNHDGSAIEEKQ